MPRTSASQADPCGAAQEDPQQWLGSTPLLDLEDTRLRLRAHALTQLCKTDREKAMAVYGFVKRMAFAKPFTLHLRSPREVLNSGRGDALDKAGLLVGLLRLAGIPSRLRYLEVSAEMLRGLVHRTTPAARPLVEIWVNGRWLRTDTYILDALYLAAAHQRLRDQGWECGYGVHRTGQSLWDGLDNAYLGGEPPAVSPDDQVRRGAYHDPLGFVSSEEFRTTHPPVARALHWNLMVPAMNRVIAELRREALAPELKVPRTPVDPGVHP